MILKRINHDGVLPKKVIIQDKFAVKQMRLIQQLKDDDRLIIFKGIKNAYQKEI
jgi:hypothetical protein